MGKRAFIREHGVLVDVFEDPPGRKQGWRMPATKLEGEPPAHVRHEILGEIRAGQGGYGLVEDSSPEHLEALLEGLRNGNIGAPMSLMKYLSDSRVQPALVEAARTVPADDVGNIAQVLGLVGGTGAREVLRQRLDEISTDPETWKFDESLNSRARPLGVIAGSLLMLEPGNAAALDAYTRLFAHVCPGNRRAAYMDAAKLLAEQRASTPELRRLATELNALADTPDDDIFLTVCAVLQDQGLVATRLLRLLDSEDSNLRTRATSRLSELQGDRKQVMAVLADHLPRESSLRVRLTIARVLGELVPHEALTATLELALEDESPSLRYRAIELLGLVTPTDRDQLVTRAVADEPDPGLRRKLEHWVRRQAN